MGCVFCVNALYFWYGDTPYLRAKFHLHLDDIIQIALFGDVLKMGLVRALMLIIDISVTL